MTDKCKRDLAPEHFFYEMRDTFMFQIHRIQKMVFRRGNHLIQEQQLPLQLEQCPILLTVNALEGLSQQEIADITQRDKSSIQRTLVALERKGLLRVVQDPSDKRRNLIYTTDEGKTISLKLKKLFKQVEQDVFAILSTEEQQRAILNIKGIADRLEQA